MPLSTEKKIIIVLCPVPLSLTPHTLHEDDVVNVLLLVTNRTIRGSCLYHQVGETVLMGYGPSEVGKQSNAEKKGK